jgi:hypothetical protein
VRPDADDRQLMRASRVASTLVLLLGGVTAYVMIVQGVTVKDAWALLAALGAGVGAVLMLRWFWWRINVWSEIAAMVGSLAIFVAVKTWQGSLAPERQLPEEYTCLIVASLTLVVWLTATFVTKPEPDATLVAFCKKVRPDGPGWSRIRNLAPEARPDGTLPASLLCALLGTAAIWLTLPGVGAVIFGEWTKATLCVLGAAIALAILLRLLPRLQPREQIDHRP